MGCGCKDKLIGFDTQPYFSTVEEFTFFPVAPFQPGFGALRTVIRKGGSASALGQAQVGVQLALPTERLVLEAGPVLLDTVRSPVGDRYAELWASEEAPSEDTILAATTGSASGVASASSFTNASTNKAQLCRVVFMADNNGAGSEGKGRAWLAVAVKWA